MPTTVRARRMPLPAPASVAPSADRRRPVLCDPWAAAKPPMTEPASEESLMSAYVAGDQRAFAELFARLGPRVHGFFVRCLGDRAMADDMLQATFLKLHRARADYRADMPLRPWVFTIAARVRLDELRRRHRHYEQQDEKQLERADRDRSVELSQGDEPDGARADIAARVRSAIARLPESQRAVVHLHRYEGLTFGEIARALETTEGAIKLRAFRAYEQLRRELQDLGAKMAVA